VSTQGLDRVIAVAESEGKVYVRQCAMKFKKSGTRIPRVELQEMGPSCTLTVRRHKAAAKELEKEACKKVKVKKIKNTKVDVLGETYGRVYMPKQEVDEMALRKMKGLKRERREAAEEKAADKKQVRAQSPWAHETHCHARVSGAGWVHTRVQPSSVSAACRRAVRRVGGGGRGWGHRA
jgi:hypothetical protein